MTIPLMRVRNLRVAYRHDGKSVPAVRGVDFDIEAGRTFAMVGESGCGKSTVALSMMGLLPAEECESVTGNIFLNQQNILTLSSEQWRALRGKRLAMVFQDPFSALNPVLTVNEQIQETIALDAGRPDPSRAEELMGLVRLDDPGRILRSYPHQLSGGQRQRVLIAIAIARRPELLIADEPTTALDVTIQDEIMRLLSSLQQELHMALFFVTHNMGLVKNVADRVAVMYAGQIVETGKTADVLERPAHPYTQGLLRCIPSLTRRSGPLPVLEGQPPAPSDLPAGCPFHPRCPHRFAPCDADDPEQRPHERTNVRCHLYPSKSLERS